MRKITNQELCRVSPEEYKKAQKLPVVVVLDNIRSANNVGSFFRTSDAFAITELILCGITATPPSKDIHKTALGAELSTVWRHFTSTTNAIETLRDEGYQIVAIEQLEGAVSPSDMQINNQSKYALIFGNEVDGVSQDAANMASWAIEIPQAGTKHSLNVAVSAGVVLWEFFKRLTIETK